MQAVTAKLIVGTLPNVCPPRICVPRAAGEVLLGGCSGAAQVVKVGYDGPQRAEAASNQAEGRLKVGKDGGGHGGGCGIKAYGVEDEDGEMNDRADACTVIDGLRMSR